MIDFDKLIHHLLIEQQVNMLDKTKCSTSAKNIFNYLCGEGAMQSNNNLVDTEPNIGYMEDCLNKKQNMIYYVHFDHLTNETSHYFIVCQIADKIIVSNLQYLSSASTNGCTLSRVLCEYKLILNKTDPN